MRTKPYFYDLLLLSIVTIWGFNFAIVKIVYRDFHPLSFNAVRFIIAAAASLLLVKLLGVSLKIDRKDWPKVFFLAILANVVYQFAFVLGLARTRAGNAGLLMGLTPIFAFMVGLALRRERFNGAILTGILLSLAGVGAIVLAGASEVSFQGTLGGDLLMILAVICWSMYSVAATPLLSRYGAIPITVLTMVIGAAIMIPISTPWLVEQNWSGISNAAWAGVLYSALGAIVYSYFVWSYALNRIGVSHTAVFANMTPIIALLGAWMLLNEAPTLPQIFGVACVLTGVFIVRSRRPGLIVVPEE